MKLSEEGKNNKKTATIRKCCNLQLTACVSFVNTVSPL